MRLDGEGGRAWGHFNGKGLGSVLGRGLGHPHDGGRVEGDRVRVREERQPMQTGRGPDPEGRGKRGRRNQWGDVL